MHSEWAVQCFIQHGMLGILLLFCDIGMFVTAYYKHCTDASKAMDNLPEFMLE